MKVVFRTDANSQIGLGHLIRSVALAEALQGEGLDCEFVIHSTSVAFISSKIKAKFALHVIPLTITSKQEPEWLNSLLLQNRGDAVMLDSYEFGQDYRRALTNKPYKVLCFDDGNTLTNLYADLVINGADNAAELGYDSSAKQAVKCLGCKFKVLRSEFSQVQLPDWSARKALTVIMGGSDPLNLTVPILQALNEQSFSGLVQLVTGAAYPYLVELEKVLQTTSLDIKHFHDCQQMAEVFAHSRLAISAAGGSQFELAACGTPALLAIVADNQINATQQAVEQGWCECVDVRLNNTVQQIVGQALSLWQNEDKLRGMAERARQTSDAKGAFRVAHAIIQLLSGVKHGA